MNIMLNGRVYDAAAAHDVINMKEVRKCGFVLHEEHDSQYGAPRMMMTIMLQLHAVILVVVDDVNHLEDCQHGDAYTIMRSADNLAHWRFGC